MSSSTDQFFSDTIVRFQQWLQFLERKQNEYQTQLNRVQRRQPVQDTKSTTLDSALNLESAANAAPEPASAPATDSKSDEDSWL